jgi:hypothetical protein
VPSLKRNYLTRLQVNSQLEQIQRDLKVNGQRTEKVEV